MSARRILGLKQVPRVWLFATKAARELGSERRETVRSLSIVGEGHMRGAVPSTRGLGGRITGATVVVPTAQQGSEM